MSPQSFRLVMQTGPNPGKVLDLSGTEVTMGRDTNNEFVINDAEVSRKHARISLQGAGYILEDLGSTNGTFIEGQRLMGPHTLRPGDLILLGENVSLRFEAASFDPDATVVSSAPGPMTIPAGMPASSSPFEQEESLPPYEPAYPEPPMQPLYDNPPPMGGALEFEVPPPPIRKKKSWLVPVGIGCGVLLCLCVALVAVAWFAPTSWWCAVVPFLFPGACP